MAESQKRDCSSATLEKDALQDLEIGKDFFSSWKSISIAEGDVLDFDITPVSKGNKKAFNFDKADMDFNLDGDFGKISSFNMDMSDLDISLPLKKDGKSKEKPKESSSGKDNGKTDRFAFAFDFDELENFSFNSSLTEEGPKAQKEKNNKESSKHGSGCQGKEGPMDTNAIGSTSTLEDGPLKPSLPEAQITFDMDYLVGGSADLEPTRKTCHSNLAMDDVATLENSAAIDGVASDKAKSFTETTIVSRELQNNSQPRKSVSPGKDAMQELSSDYLSKNESSGGYSSEAQNKIDSKDAKVTGSNGEQDADVKSVAGSTYNYKHTQSKNSQHLQTVAISENIINNEKSQEGVEDHVVEDREKTKLGSHINSLVKNPCTTSAVTGIHCDSPSGREPALEILKLPLVSQPPDLSEKQTQKGREHLVNCSQPFIQPEKPKCPLLKVSTQTTFSSLSSKKMGCAQPSLVEAREMGSADGLQNGNKMNDSSATQIKNMVKTKSAIRQREMSIKDLDTLSMEINKKAAKNSENPTTLTSIPTIRNSTVEEHKLSTESGRKTPDLPGLKLTGLSLDSTKSPIQKDSKSLGNSSQKSILSRKMPSNIAHSPGSQKQTRPILSIKRTLEDDAANVIALHPSKRISQSSSTSRNLVETSEKVLNKKVPSHSPMEEDRIKSTIGNFQVTAIHTPHEVMNKEVEISFSIQNDSNIKLADAYSKELDDLCYILRKKHDEAKEILAQAIVNSNKLLMLNNPRFEEKMRATQDWFARLTINSIHG